MSYIKVSVPKPGANAGTGLIPKSAISFIDVDDIDTFPARDTQGVVIATAITLKTNAYAVTVYATPDSIELASPSEGDTDNEGFVPTLKFKHPGNKQEIREFKTGMLGRHLVAIVDYCNGAPKDLIGSPCNPVKMQVSYTGNKDGNGNEFTFTQLVKGDDIAIYEGAMPTTTPPSGGGGE